MRTCQLVQVWLDPLVVEGVADAELVVVGVPLTNPFGLLVQTVVVVLLWQPVDVRQDMLLVVLVDLQFGEDRILMGQDVNPAVDDEAVPGAE